MEYNTQQRKLPLPEYGRSVQNMVDHALTIEDREERQRCANTIVKIMGGMFPYLRDESDNNQKLWDHLAIMSDFKLDIDYPVEVVKKESLEVKPEHIAYPKHTYRFRHYGQYVQSLVKKAAEYEDGEEKNQLINLIANQMRKDYQNWNKDSIDVQKIVDDFSTLTDGVLKVNPENIHLVEQRSFMPRRRQNNNNNNNQQKRRNN